MNVLDDDEIYRDRVSNISKGFGFVSMSSVLEANRAIKYLNGYHIHGKILKVERKKEKYCCSTLKLSLGIDCIL